MVRSRNSISVHSGLLNITAKRNFLGLLRRTAREREKKVMRTHIPHMEAINSSSASIFFENGPKEILQQCVPDVEPTSQVTL